MAVSSLCSDSSDIRSTRKEGQYLRGKQHPVRKEFLVHCRSACSVAVACWKTALAVFAVTWKLFRWQYSLCPGIRWLHRNETGGWHACFRTEVALCARASWGLWHKSTLHTAHTALLETQGPMAEQLLWWLTAVGSSAPPHHSLSPLPLQEGRWKQKTLTNYHYRQQRLSLREINVTFCPLLPDWSTES